MINIQELKGRLGRRPSGLLILSVLFWLPVILFSKFAGEILEGEPLRFDNSILYWIHARATTAWDHTFLLITSVGNIEVLGPAALLTVGWLIYKKQRISAFIVAFSVGGAAVANVFLKLLFHRARPSLWPSLITEHSYSFPSGHAMISSAFILSVIFITWKTAYRWFALTIGLAIIASIGISRVYLGVHYPSDIIAGWSVSVAWVTLVFLASQKLAYLQKLDIKE